MLVLAIDEDLMPLFFVGGVVAFVLVGLVWGAYAAKKRREALAALAGEMGFEFDKTGDAAEHWKGSGFKLFSRGSKRCRDALTTRIEDVDVCVFRYSYTTGGGKNRTTRTQTVVGLTTPGLDLPAFRLAPERFFHRLGEMVGFKDIDFDDDPAFSDQFRLTGEDETALRNVFTRELRDYFKRHPKLTTEGRGNRIVVYEAGKTQPVEGYRRFTEDAMELVVLLS